MNPEQQLKAILDQYPNGKDHAVLAKQLETDLGLSEPGESYLSQVQRKLNRELTSTEHAILDALEAARRGKNGLERPPS